MRLDESGASQGCRRLVGVSLIVESYLCLFLEDVVFIVEKV